MGRQNESWCDHPAAKSAPIRQKPIRSHNTPAPFARNGTGEFGACRRQVNARAGNSFIPEGHNQPGESGSALPRPPHRASRRQDRARLRPRSHSQRHLRRFANSLAERLKRERHNHRAIKTDSNIINWIVKSNTMSTTKTSKKIKVNLLQDDC
jgi:hypothetical protein